MRSLYTEDIVGTKPKPSIIEKSYYRKKHLEQIMRSPSNPDKSKHYEWFVPQPKAIPYTFREPIRSTLKLISEHTGPSRSMHYESLKKPNYTDRPRNLSVLSRSGITLLKNSRVAVNEGDNPYYPHRIRQAYDQSVSTRFTGNRSWNNTPNPAIYLPEPGSLYPSKGLKG